MNVSNGPTSISRAEFVRLSRQRVRHHYLVKLTACIEAVDEKHIWKRPSETCNSIGGTVLHLVEHLRRVNAACVEPAPGVPVPAGGIEEFFPQEMLGKKALAAEVVQVFDEFDEVLRAIEEGGGTEHGDVLSLARLYHVVEHLSYHLGQIVLLARLQTATRFDFVKKGINEAHLNRLAREDNNAD